MTVLPTVEAGTEAVRRDPLARVGLAVLTSGQASSGALVASPNFPVYRYAWLRDGAFCALALDTAGLPEAAAAFHRWAARVILAGSERAAAAIRAVREGQSDPPYLPTRYTLAGEPEQVTDDPWPNFQLDGYGTWLHALAAHAGRFGVPDGCGEAVGVIADYLAVMWDQPCYDCWEEFGDGHHTSTLLAVAAGLDAAAVLTGGDSHAGVAGQIRDTLLRSHTVDGRLTKSRTDPRLDASLLWAGAPFEPPVAELTRRTVDAVAAELLVPGGGVRRYLGDSYYGGGEWLLATSWLGWHAVLAGNRALAEHCDGWVRGQSTAEEFLPEQVTDHPQDPGMVEHWTRQWGPVATPLLWSHAMQIIHSAAMVQAGWPSGG